LQQPVAVQIVAPFTKEVPMPRLKACTQIIGLAVLLAATSRTVAAGVPDLSKVDRRIVKEPVYQCKAPLYGLYVFGPEAKTRVWAIFDKSKPEAGPYDILYFDRNADGDLTASDKRISGMVNGGQVTFNIGAFTDPVTKQQHTDMSITRHGGPHPMVMLRMKWCDKVRIQGGYAPDAGPYTQFASSPAEAPVLWPAADGPLSFQFWQFKHLTIGEADDVRVFLGHQGQGRNTFCAVPDTFLPVKVPVLATLLYKDKDGKEHRAQSELHERC
jgi:hypothetical protein